MSVASAVLSETGPRDENEDCAGVWNLLGNRTGIAVADGIGGHFGGKFASNLAVQRFREAIDEITSPDLCAVARDIHAAIQAEQKQRPQWSEMGTTLTAAIIQDRQLIGVHCGDTRISVSRGNGIRRLTQDHTEVQRLLQANKLTPEQALTYSRKNVLDSALGIKGDLRLDAIEFVLEPGDRLFFTSDGVHGKLKLRELFDISKRCSSPEKLIDEVKSEIQHRGPNDNYTLVCCFIG